MHLAELAFVYVYFVNCDMTTQNDEMCVHRQVSACGDLLRVQMTTVDGDCFASHWDSEPSERLIIDDLNILLFICLRSHCLNAHKSMRVPPTVYFSPRFVHS